MEKLTAQQIIEKLKTIFDSVDKFAHENHPSKVADYPEAVEADRVRNAFYKKHCINYKWESPELSDQYYKMPNGYKIAEEKWNENPDNLRWAQVHQQGGESKGDHWESVKYFPDHDVYLRVTGYYASYDGTSFDGWKDCREVKPKEKTITVYE